MAKVYLASPLFTDEQKFRINKVVKYLRNCGNDVFSPMEFTVPNAWDMSCLEWGKQVYDHDVEGLKNADVVVAIYDGLMSDSGTAWEIGYAYALKKDIILLCTDIKAKQSLMVTNSSLIIHSMDHFEQAWVEYVSNTPTISKYLEDIS